MKKTKDVLEATEILKQDRYAISLWTKAKKMFEKIHVELSANEWCASLELCTRTFSRGLFGFTCMLASCPWNALCRAWT